MSSGSRLTRRAARPLESRGSRARGDGLPLGAVRRDVQAPAAGVSILRRHLAGLVRIAGTRGNPSRERLSNGAIKVEVVAELSPRADFRKRSRKWWDGMFEGTEGAAPKGRNGGEI